MHRGSRKPRALFGESLHLLVINRGYGTVATRSLNRMSRLFQHRHDIRRLAFRSPVSLVLLGILLSRISLGEAGRALRDANYLYVLPALAVFGLAKLLVARRWKLMMSEFADVPVPPLFGILLVSNLANNVLPVRIGDVIRVQVPAQRY